MINDQGGINGRKINFISRDDGYSPPKTVELVRKLVEEDPGFVAVSDAWHAAEYGNTGLETGSAHVRKVMPASALANTRSPSTASTTRPPNAIEFGIGGRQVRTRTLGSPLAASPASSCSILIRGMAATRALKRLKKELGPLPDTVTARTGGGGRHLVFKYPPFPVRKDTSGKKFGKGVDKCGTFFSFT